jgi:copper(I)-binding protein
MLGRRRALHTIVAVALTCIVAVAHAATDIVVSNAWMRPTVEKQPVAPVYFDIRSERWRRIVEIASPDAESVVIVEGDATDDRRTKTNFVLEARKTVRFAPRGVYVELRAVKRAVKNGDAVPLTLTLRDDKGNDTSVKLSAQVRGLSAANPADKR